MAFYDLDMFSMEVNLGSLNLNVRLDISSFKFVAVLTLISMGVFEIFETFRIFSIANITQLRIAKKWIMARFEGLILSFQFHLVSPSRRAPLFPQFQLFPVLPLGGLSTFGRPFHKTNQKLKMYAPFKYRYAIQD